MLRSSSGRVSPFKKNNWFTSVSRQLSTGLFRLGRKLWFLWRSLHHCHILLCSTSQYNKMQLHSSLIACGILGTFFLYWKLHSPNCIPIFNIMSCRQLAHYLLHYCSNWQLFSRRLTGTQTIDMASNYRSPLCVCACTHKTDSEREKERGGDISDKLINSTLQMAKRSQINLYSVPYYPHQC